MGRWKPNARGRLEQAALELYVERGFEQTTVADIARRAGLTERTFFRHFADKREVLFWGARALEELVVKAVAEAPASMSPVEAVAAALEAAGALLQERRQLARLRQSIITANAELRERELIKLASLSSSMAAALRRRGVVEPSASLTAEAGMAVFRIAFERWVADAQERDLPRLIRASLAELKSVVAGSSWNGHPAPRDAHTRQADTLARLTAEHADIWVASASIRGAQPQAHLIPLSLAWIDGCVVVAAPAEQQTGRNIRATGKARLALGPTRDVVLIDADLERLVGVLDAPAEFAERYAAQAGWDPRQAGAAYAYLVLRPRRIQAWREENELAGRTLMRDGAWLVPVGPPAPAPAPAPAG